MLFYLLFFAVMAAMTSARSSNHTFHVQWHFDKTTQETALAVTDFTQTQILAYTCGTQVLLSGKSVSVDATPNAQGNITVDGTIYKIHSDPAHSGGISCGSIYSADESFFDCEVHLQLSEADLTPLDPAVLRICFSKPERGTFSGAMQNMMTSPGFTPTTTPQVNVKNETSLDKRWDMGCGGTSRHAELVGDGNPHQNWLHKQVTVRIATPNLIITP